MGFVKWSATTGKPVISDGAKKEAALLYHHQIIKFVEEHDIPSSFVVKFDVLIKSISATHKRV